MGWWNVDGKGRRMKLGDEPIDLLHEVLRAFADCYAEELGRKPTTLEFLFSLQNALHTTGRDVFTDLAAQEVASVKIVTKKAPKIHKYGIGDYFAIPLKPQDFAYGRIIGADAAGAVIEVYHLRSRHCMAFGPLKRQAKTILIQTHVHGLLAFRTGRWPVLGHAMLPQRWRMPSFRLGSGETGWLIARGRKQQPATVEAVLRLEPVVCWNPTTVEERIVSDHPEVWPELEEWQCRDFGDRYLKIVHDPGKLRRLFLQFADVTDAGLRYLARCSELTTLNLFSRPVTDSGLRSLRHLGTLEELNLGRTQITDAGLVFLRALKTLKKLELGETRVSDEGIRALQKALPGTSISWRRPSHGHHPRSSAH
ncbi:MAG TPA: Imm26 family immunity protein [Gemmataceae bacterium]|nr:Imm26 family immunity protein [Gemmataceae bacterium]